MGSCRLSVVRRETGGVGRGSGVRGQESEVGGRKTEVVHGNLNDKAGSITAEHEVYYLEGQTGGRETREWGEAVELLTVLMELRFCGEFDECGRGPGDTGTGRLGR